MSDELLYLIVDAVQVPIYYDSKRDQLRGAMPKTVNVGPWKAKVDVMIESDQDEQRYSSCFVKVRKHLWSYMIAEARDKLYCVFFDGHEAGIKTFKTDEFMTRSVLGTMQKLAPYSKAVYSFDPNTEQWAAIDSDAFLKPFLPQANPVVEGKLAGPDAILGAGNPGGA